MKFHETIVFLLSTCSYALSSVSLVVLNDKKYKKGYEKKKQALHRANLAFMFALFLSVYLIPWEVNTFDMLTGLSIMITGLLFSYAGYKLLSKKYDIRFINLLNLFNFGVNLLLFAKFLDIIIPGEDES